MVGYFRSGFILLNQASRSHYRMVKKILLMENINAYQYTSVPKNGQEGGPIEEIRL